MLNFHYENGKNYIEGLNLAFSLQAGSESVAPRQVQKGSCLIFRCICRHTVFSFSKMEFLLILKKTKQDKLRDKILISVNFTEFFGFNFLMIS